VKERFFAIINPAAAGGRCGKLADSALNLVRQVGVELEVARTSAAGDATALARRAYNQGFRNFLAVGGDGTSFEILNGLFPQALTGDRVSLGFLPLGTGNSFLKDFTSSGMEYTLGALENHSRRACDVIRLHHADGDLYFLNLLSLGFPADVGALTNRRFKRLGELGYILGVFARVANLQHFAFPHRRDGGEWDARPCLFLSFSNSKFTGGKMMIAPNADPADGQIECVRWGPIGRFGLIRTLPQLFTGAHIRHPLASRAPARRIDFDLGASVNVLLDGEVLQLDCRSLEVLPGALDAVV
jgi:diacylglycerol kinase (ATP)